jgi:Domain of Unknown Function (DUF1080)
MLGSRIFLGAVLTTISVAAPNPKISGDVVMEIHLSLIKIIDMATKLTTLFICIIFLTSCSSEQELFNGKDLTGWDTYIGPAYDTVTQEFDKAKIGGLNSDPEKVFNVVQEDGQPAMRISGQHFGGISTIQEFSNYHLTLQFKWGKLKSPPKKNSKRDSGLLYHANGDQAGDGSFWMRSQEFQIQEGDCGDYWGVAGALFDIPAIKKDSGEYVYDASGTMTTFMEGNEVGRHCIKNPDAEKSTGEWNIVELYCFGGTSVHIVNGVVTMVLFNSRQKVGGVVSPLTKGKIQIQSEGAEVFYRDLKVEEITSLPSGLVTVKN